MSEDLDLERRVLERPLSRQQFLKLSAAAAAAAGAGSLVASAGAATPRTGLTPADVATIRKLIGPLDARTSGKGMRWTIGTVLALSGPGSYYGYEMGNGIKLAVKHIAQLGGPTIDVRFLDHKSGDPQAGIQAAIKLRDAKAAAALTSYGGDVGAMLPGLARYKILGIDQGGGAEPPYFNRKPYFWGMRGGEVTDYFPIMFQYVKARMPSARKVMIMALDYGAFTAAIVPTIEGYAKALGFEVVGVVKPKPGATDFSNEIAALRAQPADVIVWQTGQLDEAYFMKQYRVSGIHTPIFATEWVGPTAKVAGNAYNGMYFVQDDFNPSQPANPWAEAFVRDYRATFGTNGIPVATPDFYSAGYYSSVFVLWALLRRVLKRGGSPTSGAALQAELEANPRFPVLFGGGANAAGVFEFDPVEHNLKHLPIALYQIKDRAPVKLATADKAGRHFRLVTAR